MIVDTHAHYLPEQLLINLKKNSGQFPNVDCVYQESVWKLGFSGGPPSRPIISKLRESDSRLAWMDDQKIDVMVCAGWLDSFGYELPDQEGTRWSQFINEHLIRACEETKRFAPLCTVPLQNGAMAARVLQESLAMGFHGAMIGTLPKGGIGNLDDPDLNPFWEIASELEATIYLHPMFGCGDPRLVDYKLVNTVGRGLDTTTAMARLIFSGHLERFRGMKFVLSHGGGGLPFLQGRLQLNHTQNPEFGNPEESLKRCYFDSVVLDGRVLEFICRMYGSEQIMMGSDYPFAFGDLEPRKIIEQAELSNDDRKNILGSVAERVFHLENCGCTL
ncbi:MAG: amidohydrolase family protein [Rhodospirillaceae bacterium]